MLTIEIKGIGFQNRGAELMLNAIMERFQKQFGQVRFVVEPPVNLSQLKYYRLGLKSHYLRRGINVLAPLNFLPRMLLNFANVVKPSEVDIVVDASGYSYGDPWTPGMMRNRLSLEIAALKGRNVPVVLLPQALGPFNRDSVRKAFLPIYRQANLIFPRDKQSLHYLNSLGNTPAQLRQAPDFSNLVETIPYDEFTPSSKSLCLVPNQKMLDKTAFTEAYLSFCRSVLLQSIKAGYSPFILVHEQAEDAGLAQQIIAPLSSIDVPVVTPQTAKQCKWVIARSRLVVASRYHGLVSALSQAVPAFATSWSHKYQSLLDDYQMSEQLIDLSAPDTEAERVVMLLQNENALTDMRNLLAQSAEREKQKTEDMWQNVFATLN